MTRDELAARVQDIHARHADVAAPANGGVGVPPTDEETAILVLDKCMATADALGIASEPDDWKPDAPQQNGSWTVASHAFYKTGAPGDGSWIFDADDGMRYRNAGGSEFATRSAEDVTRIGSGG